MFRHLICQASAQSSSRLQERRPSCSQGLGLRASGCPWTETAPGAWAHSLAKVAPQTGRWAEGGRRERGPLWEGAPLSSHRPGCTCTGGWTQRRTDTCVCNYRHVHGLCAHSVSQLRWARGPGAGTAQPQPLASSPVLPGEAVGSLWKSLTPGLGRGPAAACGPRDEEGAQKAHHGARPADTGA